MENVGKIALADITLVEDPNEDDGRHTDDEGKWDELDNTFHGENADFQGN